ncbi:MAG: IS1634 family transposase [Candidatus Pacearchaeota archaeon]|jgi:transposase
MASIQCRTSRGKKYWSIVESRRVNGKPRTFILEYLGTPSSLLNRLKNSNILLKSYSHGDTSALLNIAKELDILNIINKHVPYNKTKRKPIRDGLTVGATLLLAAIGRACHPTSKMAWYDWCKETSLEYCLKTSFKKLDSQHFWDQMNFLPSEVIDEIEEEMVQKLIATYEVKPGALFFDTTNFFTFIDSSNENCDLPQRGRNKQKRFDLRQIGMALLVSKDNQFPLFHKTYRGNKNDITVFKETYNNMISRLKKISKELSDITIVFDKGNNSKDNFALIDNAQDCYYVGGLVSSYFKELLKEANDNFTTVKIEGEEIPIYKVKKMIWGQERTCVITVSAQLKEGQICGIKQHLEKKYKMLNKFKQQLESPKRKKDFTKEEIKAQLIKTIKGQFIEEILKYEFIKLDDKHWSFTYGIDGDAFDKLKKEILGRKIVVTNRHDWSSEEILLAYRGQSKVEYAFRTLKNPYHMAIRPQYHWTDQKIEVHFLICLIGYLLTTCAYSKIKKHYKRNIIRMMDDLRAVRLSCVTYKNNKVKYQLEEIPKNMQIVLNKLNISNDAIRQNFNFSDYISN